MRSRVLIDTNQKVSVDDFNKFGTLPRDSFDSVVYNLLIPDKAFSGFQTTTTTSGAVINVAKGELWFNGKDYYNDQTGGTNIDLADRLPSVTRRYIAIVVAGSELPAAPLPKTFLTDAATRDTIARTTSTEVRRWASLSPVSGEVGADPVRPAVASDVVPVAWVLVDPTGVVAIERATEYEAPTLREADDRLNEYDEWKAAIGAQLDTLKSDLAGLARKLADMASANFVTKLAIDMARVKEKMQLPSAFSAYHADYFIDTTYSDTTHVDYLAEIQDGVRFPPAAIQDTQLGLLNAFDETVSVADYFAIPAYTEKARLNVIQRGAFGDAVNGPVSIPISGWPYISGAFFAQLQKFRSRFRYGPELPEIRNMVNYFTASPTVANDPVSQLFRLNDTEVFSSLTAQESQVSSFDPRRIPGIWIDRFKTAGYWAKRQVTYNISGSGLCQTFYNAQDGWLTSVNFALSQVGASGDMEVLICECDSNGVPQAKRIIARSTVLRANMKVLAWGPPEVTTQASFSPTFLFAGQRYGVIVMSAGNHRFWLVQRNKFTQGQLFNMTGDGLFSPVLTVQGLGTNEPDLGIRVNFAEFNSPRTIVAMNPLQLSGGIAKVDLLMEAIVPSQGSIEPEVQIAGNWVALNRQVDSGSHPFAGLPPLLPFRLVLNGTTDSMPGFGVGVNSRVRTSRARSDYKHISLAQTFPSTTTIKAFYRVENWRTTGQTLTFRLMTGAGFTTLTAPTTDVRTVAPDDPSALEVALSWTVTAQTTCKFQAFGTSDNVLSNYHLSQRVDVET